MSPGVSGGFAPYILQTCHIGKLLYYFQDIILLCRKVAVFHLFQIKVQVKVSSHNNVLTIMSSLHVTDKFKNFFKEADFFLRIWTWSIEVHYYVGDLNLSRF